MSDRIEIRGLRELGHHGVLDFERRDGQPFVVDADIDIDLARAATTDDLADTVDYGTLANQFASAVRDTRFDLIEALASHLADLAFADPRVEAVRVRVAKPKAPVRPHVDEVAVVIRRTRDDRSGR